MSFVVILAVLATALLLPSSAEAAARSRALFNGGAISIRSGDGCRVKPVKLAIPRNTRRDFTCVISGKSVMPPLGVTSFPIQTLFNGDTMSLVSGDGCKLKIVKSGLPGRFRRDFSCVVKGKLVVPPPPPPPPSPPQVAGQPPPGVTGGATWRGIFADDFNGTAVNSALWNVANNSNFGSGNDEDQCYRRPNVTVAGGTLRLTAQRQTVSGCGNNPDGGDAYYFTSGMVTTRGQDGPLRMKYRHGYAEVQMRVPRGNIYWSAFWLADPLDGSSPGWPAYGEVDGVEIYGSRPDVYESNFHRTGGNIGARTHNVNNPPSGSLGMNINPPNAFQAGGTNNWHRYGINWSANQLQWYVDGVLVRTYTGSGNNDLAALNYEKSIILNLAMGGTGPEGRGYTGNESGGGYNNGNLAADLPGTMEIDYVRVWQP